MRPPDPSLLRVARVAALAGIGALGLLTIVGSGGGLPSDCPPGDDCGPPPPTPSVDVAPRYVTVLAGSHVTWTATATHAGDVPAYQWSKSTDGGATWVDIAGATGPTLALASTAAGDDLAEYRVTLRSGGFVAHAEGRLAVSSTPGVVIQDGEFQPSGWLVTPFADANEPAPVHTEERVPAGGHPGAYWKMVYTLPAQALAGRVLYTSLTAGWDPATQGAIHVIDYAEDAIALQPDDTTSTESALLIEQSGRHFVGNQRVPTAMIPVAWSPVESAASLRPQDFTQIDGPACGAGESCPDFSAAGAPLRFGFWRISFGTQGQSIAHGIDNWKVTVWGP